MPEFISLAPDPKSHIKTLTRIGYTLESAVADILDNSITALCSKISIEALPGLTERFFSITDDGEGMSPEELLQNMRIGCKDPHAKRSEGDLGRFGSGMKTASFSQARRLTVISKAKGGELAAATWDLDEIESQNDWCLQVLSAEEIFSLPNVNITSDSLQGTQVIWEKLTFIPKGSHSSSEDDEMASALDGLEKHISLHFHRFMAGKKRCVIEINGSPLDPIDPFLTDEPGYQEGRTAKNRCKGGKIVIRTHVLPHLVKLSKETLQRHGGAANINEHQGIYIYRNRRLINAGGWLGLNRSNQLHALARVQVDVPSSLDDEWRTDVKKSSLQLPARVKSDLKKYLAEPVTKSKRVYSYRGKQDVANQYWKINEREDTGVITYGVSSENHELKEILASTSAQVSGRLIRYLTDLATHLPLNHIYDKMSSSPRGIDQSANEAEDFNSILKSIVARLGK
jgi:hypothetical protein